MRVSFLCKVCLLFILALCTFAVTSSLVGKTRSKRKGQGQVPASITVTKRQIGDAENAGQPATGGSAHLRGLTVTANGNSIEVGMAADIVETRADTSFVWKLQVTTADRRTVVHETLYDKQIFNSKDGAQTPTRALQRL